MKNWSPNPPDLTTSLIDHVTDFRLTRSEAYYKDGSSETWWSVLIELENSSIDDFAKKTKAFDADRIIPVAYDATDRARKLASQPLVIYARKALIQALNKKHNTYDVVSIRLGAIVPNRFLDRTSISPTNSEIQVSDDTVVMAVIDEGIGIAHNLLRNTTDSSRIEHVSLFDAIPVSGSQTSVGRCYDRAGVNQLLGQSQFNDMLDEEIFYALAGQIDHAENVFSSVALRTSHGTHVTALAAGQTCDTPNRPVICVGLPARLVADTTGLDGLPELYLAFHILAKQAQRFRCKNGKLAPVVFNLSFGNVAGPHDGTSSFAELFELYFGPKPIFGTEPQTAWLTLPAGNTNLQQLHATDAHTPDGKPTELDLIVLPDDRTPTIVELWMPQSDLANQKDFAKITLHPPMGAQAINFDAKHGQSASLIGDNGEEIARMTYQFVQGKTQRGCVTLLINPTAHLSGNVALAPAGNWHITLNRSAATGNQPIHMWVRRDETMPGTLSGARQAFFDAPSYIRFDKFGAPLATDPQDSDCPVTRSITLSGFACGASPIVVAAYSKAEAELSPYSSAGPMNPRHDKADRLGPDLTAKGDDSYVLRGVYSAGSRSGSWVRLSGTSVAAPRIARAIANTVHGFSGNRQDLTKEIIKQYPEQLQPLTKATRMGIGAANVPID